MNFHAVRAIYMFEMARTFRTILQSIAAPVLSTSLYFIVFGSAIGSRMTQIEGIPYGAFIIPGLTMLSLLNESVSNAAFGIYMPRFSGTIYEVLSAPVSWVEMVLGYVGAAASKSRSTIEAWARSLSSSSRIATSRMRSAATSFVAAPRSTASSIRAAMISAASLGCPLRASTSA